MLTVSTYNIFNVHRRFEHEPFCCCCRILWNSKRLFHSRFGYVHRVMRIYWENQQPTADNMMLMLMLMIRAFCLVPYGNTTYGSLCLPFIIWMKSIFCYLTWSAMYLCTTKYYYYLSNDTKHPFPVTNFGRVASILHGAQQKVSLIEQRREKKRRKFHCKIDVSRW